MERVSIALLASLDIQLADFLLSEGLQIVQMIPGNDTTVPLVLQEMMSERARSEGREDRIRTVRIPGIGHIFTVSEPEFVVKELVELAKL